MATWLDLVVSPSNIASATALPLAEQADLLRQWSEHVPSAPPLRRLLMVNLSLTLLHRAAVPIYALPESAPPLRTLASLIEAGWATLEEVGGQPELFLSLPAAVRTLWLARWTVQLLPRLYQPDPPLEARAPAAEAALGEALAKSEDDGTVSGELAEWLVAAGRAGEAKAFLLTAISRSAPQKPRLQALLAACNVSLAQGSAIESFPGRLEAALASTDSSALSSLLQRETLSPSASKYRAWREAIASERTSDNIAVLRAYNSITFGHSFGAAPLSPTALIPAADWVLSYAPALVPRATRFLLSLPRNFLPSDAQLPPNVSAVLSHRFSTQPVSATLVADAPLPSPAPPPAVNPLLGPLLAAAALPPFELAPDSVLQACAAPPSFDSLRADEAASIVSVLAGVVSALGLGPTEAPLPLNAYGAAATAAASAVAPIKDTLHTHANVLFSMWRSAAAQLRSTDPGNPLPYLVEADILLESTRRSSALAPLLRYWAAVSASFARPLPLAVVSDVSWRRAALAAAAQGLPIAGAAMALFAPTPDRNLAARLVTEASMASSGQGGGIIFAEYLTEPALLEVLQAAPGRPRAQLLALLSRPEASQHNAPAARAAYLASKRAAFLKRLLSVAI